VKKRSEQRPGLVEKKQKKQQRMKEEEEERRRRDLWGKSGERRWEREEEPS